jgi:hypothetical protein
VDDTWDRGNQDDWAIGRLARPVRGIEPYHLPERLDVGALFLEIYRRLHDPGQNRPEWPWLLLENGESVLRRHRLADAFQCFHSADAQEAGCITWPRSTQPAYETEASFSLLAGESHRMWQHWRRRSA